MTIIYVQQVPANADLNLAVPPADLEHNFCMFQIIVDAMAFCLPFHG